MKKICIFLLILSFVGVMSSGCAQKQKPNLIQSKRRFADYVSQPQTVDNKNVIDLSEGPRLDYDKKLGPQNLNFEIKIIDPY